MREVLEREQVIPRPRAQVFAFFADAANLERLTPAALHFQIRSTLPPRVTAGTTINYKISLFGFPFPWRTLIELFEPELRFVDVQLRGPYRLWRHTHEFVEVPGGTLVRDHVEYELPLGPLGQLVAGRSVRRQLARIFDFRRETLGNIFPPSTVS